MQDGRRLQSGCKQEDEEPVSPVSATISCSTGVHLPHEEEEVQQYKTPTLFGRASPTVGGQWNQQSWLF